MALGRILKTRGALALKGAWLLAALLPTFASAESLMDAYKLARESDPKYRAVQTETRAVGTAIDQARAGFLPFVKYDWEQWESRQRVISTPVDWARESNTAPVDGMSSQPCCEEKSASCICQNLS